MESKYFVERRVNMASGSKGNCFICGAELGKTAMKNHLFKLHNEEINGQECYLLKVEGAYNKDYWLYIDLPMEKLLSDVDSFLRKIWLECCGHLSSFSGSGHSEIAKSRKMRAFTVGDKLLHEYDFGSTTETIITISGAIKRKPQRGIVRLLARNIPPKYSCSECGSPADYICTECVYDSDSPFYCEECGESHEHNDMLLSVTNSPRMGTCGYDGELDTYTFNSGK